MTSAVAVDARAPAGSRVTVWLVVPLFLLSGVAGLVYEIVWSRLLALVMGATTFAIATVLVAFMGGLALGSYLAGRVADRIRRPTRVYGVLEILIGLYGLSTPLLFRAAVPLYALLYDVAEQNFAVLTAARFCLSGLFLLIPTTMMGATLPLLVQYVAQIRGRVGGSVALLYAINTFGAVGGVVVAGFVSIPLLGMQATTMIAAGINLAVGIVACFLPAGLPEGALREMPRRRVAPSQVGEAPGLRLTRAGTALVLTAFALSGFCAMVYQVAWTRVLILSVGPTTYGFSMILCTFILGIAVGSIAIAPLVDRWRRPVLVFGVMEVVIGASALVALRYFGEMPEWTRQIIRSSGNSFAYVLWRQTWIVLALTIVPTFLMGAIFPLINRLCAPSVAQSGRTVGIAYAVNTAGTILGSFGAGFVMIPHAAIGVQKTILIAVGLNLAAGAGLVLYAWRRQWSVLAPAALGLAALTVVFMPRVGAWDRQALVSAPYWGHRGEQPKHQRLLFYREGVDATVAVTEYRDVRSLRISGKIDASDGIGDGLTHLGFAHVGMLSGGPVERALLIGLGSGITLGSLACYAEVEELDCVEISEGVVEAAGRFYGRVNYEVLRDPRVRMIRGDGRNHLLLTDRQYDLIVSIPSNPWMAGVANLFTREYFELCRQRLRPGGRVCSWLQLYSISEADFKSVIRTAFEVFPHVSLWQGMQGDTMLIASVDPPAMDVERILAAFDDPRIREDLGRIWVQQPGHLLGGFICAGERLRAWAADAPLHTDDNARLEFSTPRALFTTEQDSLRLVASLYSLMSDPFGEVIRYDPQNRRHEAVHQQVLLLQESRRKRLESDLASYAGQRDPQEYVRSIRLIREAARLAPLDWEANQMLARFAAGAYRKGEEFRRSGDPALVALGEELQKQARLAQQEVARPVLERVRLPDWRTPLPGLAVRNAGREAEPSAGG